MTIPKLLSEQLTTALRAVLGDALPAEFASTVTPSQDLRFGDYQSNAAMMLAKQARMNPRALATEVIEKFGESEIATLEIAGPGFINFRVKPAYFATRTHGMLSDERLGVSLVENPKTIVIDFSAP
ncbi:MAG: arginine--tRNA ligase, partial [Akkermansia sp.]|nr:arginine--tRNA ligase [Akkermansia sp.]